MKRLYIVHDPREDAAKHVTVLESLDAAKSVALADCPNSGDEFGWLTTADAPVSERSTYYYEYSDHFFDGWRWPVRIFSIPTGGSR